MAINKNAILRYRTLDRCFSNFGRKYYFNDLLEEVNSTLFDDNEDSTGIQVRQLRDDIRYMKSEAGFSAPIESYREGKKAYYRYATRDFSINNSPLNSTEAEQLSHSVSILRRFEGAPGFEWVDEITNLLRDRFQIEQSDQRIMEFESNIDYSGHKFITPLFNAIVNKRVLNIDYKPFSKKSFKIDFHPSFLKQYNNRWFVFGYEEVSKNEQYVIALDRIEEIDECDKKYRKNTTNWEDYLYDIIGVTRQHTEPILVQLLFNKEQAPYVETKPIHATQTSKSLEDGSLLVNIKVILNYELESQILSYGQKVKVLSPKRLSERIKERLNQAMDQY